MPVVTGRAAAGHPAAVRRSSCPRRGATPRAVALTSRAREHSVAELRDKLDGRGHCEPAAIEAILALVDDGLLNDERFVEHFVAQHAGRGQGPVRIRGELRERGVAAELIDERARRRRHRLGQPRAEASGVKRFGASLPADCAGTARQARFLQYRGFSRGSDPRRARCDSTIGLMTT